MEQTIQEYERELADLRQRWRESALLATEMHGELMDAQRCVHQLHDAIFDHNIASLGNRTIEELRAADQRLLQRWKELVERKRGSE